MNGKSRDPHDKCVAIFTPDGKLANVFSSESFSPAHACACTLEHKAAANVQLQRLLQVLSTENGLSRIVYHKRLSQIFTVTFYRNLITVITAGIRVMPHFPSRRPFRLLPKSQAPNRLLACALLASCMLAQHALGGTVQFSATSIQANESDGVATITIQRSGDFANAASVGIVFTHGTATASDFSLAANAVSWAAGDGAPKTVDVTLISDGNNEGNETAHFTLTNASGDTLGSNSEIELQILEGAAINGTLTTPMQKILTTLNNICGGQNSGELEQGCARYRELPADQKQQAANTMLPRQVAAQVTNVSQAQQGANQAVQQRMQNVRSGGGGNALGGLNLMMDGERVPVQAMVNEWQRQHSEDAVGGNAGDELLDDRFGVFVSGQLQISDKDSTVNELGYKADSQQLTAGLDYRATSELFFGGALSYSTSNTDYNADGGKQDADVVILNLYGNYYLDDNWYVDGLLNFGNASFDSKRTIVLGPDRFTASSNTDGNQWGTAVTAGYDKAVREWQFGGYGRVEFNKFDIDGYEESGGGGFALAIDKHDAESKKTAFGGSISYVKSVSYGIWVPKLNAEWVHEFDDSKHDLSARFVNAPSAGDLILPTNKQDSDYFNVGWSLAGTFSRGRSAWLRYEAQLGRDDYIAELVEIGARIPF